MSIAPPRAQAQHIEGSRVRVTWPCGHSRTKDYAKGPVAKRVPESGVRILVKMWRSTGLNAGWCPTCKREDR